MNLKLLLQNEDLQNLLNNHETLINLIINKKPVSELEEIINTCSEYALALGMQHGHSVFVRKCHSAYISGSKNMISLINIKKTYYSLINAIASIFQKLQNKENIFICTKISLKINKENIYISNRWMPGTLTNSKHVIHNYENLQFKKFGLIISTITISHPVISREVYIMNEKRPHQTKLISIVDTNISVIEEDNNFINIMLNDESPYYNLILSHLLKTILK
ncbi:hypothetical protein AB837_00395 [bacterium AB1]|nr:hypothetical protein AB837_00395 [bacterium AB1]